MQLIPDFDRRLDFEKIKWRNLIAVASFKQVDETSTPADIKCYYWEDLDDIKSLQPVWVLTFPEITLLTEAFKECRLVYDIRRIQERVKQTDHINAVCKEFSERFYALWKITRDDRYYKSAWEFALEYWFRKEDVTNLVAIWPDKDLLTFLKSGRAARVYRLHTYHPLEGDSNQVASSEARRGKKYTVGNLPEHFEDGEGYSSYIYCFPVLNTLLGPFAGEGVFDIGKILWRAGRTADLARTLWLFARDIFHQDAEATHQIDSNLEILKDMVLRAIGLYGFESPLSVFFKEDVTSTQKAYQFLIDIMEAQKNEHGDSPEDWYWQALQYWFGKHLWKELDALPNAAVAEPNIHLKLFTQSITNVKENGQKLINRLEESATGVGRRAKAEDLITYCEILQEENWPRGVIVSTNPPLFNNIDIHEYHSRLMDSSDPIPVPSQPFFFYFEQYKSLFGRWCELRNTAEIIGHQSTTDLKQLKKEYEDWMAGIRTYPHEAFILHEAAHHDVLAISHKIEQGKVGAHIAIDLQTPWMVRCVNDNLIVDIRNTGEDVATDLSLELELPVGIDLKSERVLAETKLEPGQIARKLWSLFVKADVHFLNFSIKFDFLDKETGQKIPDRRTWSSLEVKEEPAGELFTFMHGYKAGDVVYEKNFYGRKTEIYQLLVRILTRNNTLIYGPQRMGKTSLLKELECILDPNKKYELDRFNFPSVMVDRMKVVLPVFISLQKMIMSPHLEADFFQNHVFNAIFRALNGADAFPPNLREDFILDPMSTCQRELQKIFTVHSAMKIVMLVDEWDRLYAPGYTDLATNLRSLILEEKRISWLFTSIYGMAYERVKGGSPLHNILSPYRIHEMNTEDATRLIAGPGLDANLIWQGKAALNIVEQTSKWPYLIQEICVQILDELKDQKVVELELVEQVLKNIIERKDLREKIFGQFWIQKGEEALQGMSIRWMGCLVLRSIMENKTKRKEIYQWIRSQLAPLGELPPQSLFLIEFEQEVYKLEWVFGAIEQRTSKDYRFSVPLIERAVNEFIYYEDDLVAKAYAGILSDIDQNSEKFIQDGELCDYFN